jgi:hypothetical protein
MCCCELLGSTRSTCRRWNSVDTRPNSDGVAAVVGIWSPEDAVIVLVKDDIGRPGEGICDYC